MSHFTILVNEHDAEKRLDVFVASYVSGCSRSLSASLIRKGKILVNGTLKKPGYYVRKGDEICGLIPSPKPFLFEPEPAVEIHIIYEDEHLIVINKQPGLVVHPAPGHYEGTLVNGLLYHCPILQEIGEKLRHGIVHRLDKNTSGALVVAKNEVAYNDLALQFKSRTIKKRYLAIVHGKIESDSGAISLPIGRHPIDRKKMSTISRKTRSAETSWKVVERFCDATLLEINLKTGRTHQIRVHCSAINHPVLGDSVYCGRNTLKKLLPGVATSDIIKVVPRQMLHAWQLEFTHPVAKIGMSFEAPVPQDMKKLIKILRPLQKSELVNAKNEF
ncbi:MAG: RluA family pseudouridine synthase [Desulfobacterales bacterium]|nr:RluA family pseudouridine synthase [Desulfobacterales bacterium]